MEDQTLSLGSEPVKSQTGHPSPGVQWGEGKPPWLLGELLGQIEDREA